MAEWKEGDRASEALDRDDMVRLMHDYGPTISRCVCGRLRVSGFVCDICGESDGVHWGERKRS